jgi:hypothetical protein
LEEIVDDYQKEKLEDEKFLKIIAKLEKVKKDN